MLELIPIIIFLSAVVVGWYVPRAGILLTVLTLPAYVVKFSIGPIPTQLNELILLGVFVGWLAKSPLLNLRQLLQAYRPIQWWLLCLGIGLIIGVVVSTDLRLSLGIVKGWFVDPILLFGLIVAVIPIQQLSDILFALILSTLPLSVWAIIQVATHNFITIDGRASAWFASANYLALYLVPILLLSTNLLFDPGHRRPWPFFLLTGLPSLLAIYWTYSYSGWLGLVAGALVIGLWKLRSYWQFWIVSLGTVLVVGLTQLSTDRVARMLDFSAQSSASVRLQVWATDWLMTQAHWLTGIGLGQYPLIYPSAVIRLFPTPLEPNMLHAHNLYFQFLLNLGVVGLVGFIGLVVVFFLWLRLKRYGSFWSVPLASAMVAILAHGLVDTPYWKNDLAMLFWVIVSITYIRARTIRNKLPDHD